MTIVFRKPVILLLSCAVLALSGCAHMGAASGDYWLKPGQWAPSSRAASLLLYFDYVRHLPTEEQRGELDGVQQLVDSAPSNFHSLQYALALSLPGGDLKKAQQLAEAANADPDPELAALATLLSADIAERRRLEGEAKRADGEARRADSEAKRADAEARRADAEMKKSEAEMKRADELQKKLEAVKNIEKNLIERKKMRGEKR